MDIIGQPRSTFLPLSERRDDHTVREYTNIIIIIIIIIMALLVVHPRGGSSPTNYKFKKLYIYIYDIQLYIYVKK